MVEAADGRTALDKFAQEEFALVLLGDAAGARWMDGLPADAAKVRCAHYYAHGSREEIDRVTGFELGVDDYVVKPFSPRELVMRVKALLGGLVRKWPNKKKSWSFPVLALTIRRGR